jgi:hypothetical protein
MDDGDFDGWCEGRTVFMADGRASPVLGPDGQPVKYIRRHVAGFDLMSKSRKSSESKEHD